MIAPVLAHGGTVHFVHLTCTRDVLLARVAHESRRAFGKLTDPAAVAALLDQGDRLAPLPFDESLEVDTTALPPTAAAAAIMAHFALPTIP